MADESLQDLYVAVTGDKTLTYRQEESRSHEPLSRADRELEQYLTSVAGDDGLTDALDGSEPTESPP